jgi:SAM-dependent methyltransferase
MNELDKIAERYERRKKLPHDYWNPLNSYNSMLYSERRFALIRWIKHARLTPVSEKSVLEIGCGAGYNLLELLNLGFSPEKLTGVELLPEPAEQARQRLPRSTKIITGDALQTEFQRKFDVVMQFTVFTSILDNSFQNKLAERMWDLAARAGGILSYDFMYNNPFNPDVRGLPYRRIRELFPRSEISKWRLTLAPPLGRFATKASRHLYSIFNLCPLLRTHLLCWMPKP